MSKPMQSCFFMKCGAETTGPLTAIDLLDAVKEGRLSRTDFVRKASSNRWVSAGRVGWLFSTPVPQVTAKQPKAAQPRPELANDQRKAAQRDRPRVLTHWASVPAVAARVRNELVSTLHLIQAKVRRLISWVVAHHQARRLQQEADAAMTALGERLYRSALGDMSIRTEIAAIDGEAQLGHRSRQSARERVEHITRLAKDWTTGSSRPCRRAPYDLTQTAIRLTNEAANQSQIAAQHYHELLPSQRADRIRLTICVAACLLMIWYALGGFAREAGVDNVEYPFGLQQVAHWQAYVDKQQQQAEEEQRLAELVEARRAQEQRDRFDGAIASGERAREAGDLQLAMREYLRATSIDEDRPESHHGLGLASMQLEQWEDAIQRLGEALSEDYEYSPALIARGKCYLAINKNDSAIDDFTRAIAIDPSTADTYASRSEAHRKDENYRDAIRDATVAIRLDGSLVTAYFQRGAARLQGDPKQLEGAIQDLSHVIRENPEMADACYLRGQANELVSNHAQALADFARASDLDPELTQAVHARLRIAKATDDHPLIVSMITELMERGAYRGQKELAQARRQRGLSLLALHDYQAAEGDFTFLIERDGSDIDAYQHRLSIRKSLGAISGAEADAAKIAQLERARTSTVAESKSYRGGMSLPYSMPSYQRRSAGNYNAAARAAQENAAREMRRYRSQMSGQMGAMGVPW